MAKKTRRETPIQARTKVQMCQNVEKEVTMILQDLKTFETDQERWQAVIQRDAGADGQFFYSVKTTGVYCRPNCGARQPLRENLAFYETREQAEAAGFRPCKRCKPQRPGAMNDYAAEVAGACRTIETAETMPSLDALAKDAGLSSYYFHRIFKKYTGVTPKAYGQAHRGNKVKDELRARPTVTDALFEAGYQASSRFYEDSKGRLGMTPGTFKRGGQGETIRYAVTQSILGPMMVAATAKGVCLIHFGDSEASLNEDLKANFPKARLLPGDDEFGLWLGEVVQSLDECRPPHPSLPLDIRGTAFQQLVWQALREIPLGETVSYAGVAKRIGKPDSSRAVARACAANQLAVVVPCHRVVRADGDISGYRWGKTRKQELLDREASQ